MEKVTLKSQEGQQRQHCSNQNKNQSSSAAVRYANSVNVVVKEGPAMVFVHYFPTEGMDIFMHNSYFVLIFSGL